jgi:hypothetical protein
MDPRAPSTPPIYRDGGMMTDTAETNRRYALVTVRRNKTSRGALAIVLGCVIAGALLTAGPASAASRGFKLRNESTHALRLEAVKRVPTFVCVRPERCYKDHERMDFEGRPADGTVLGRFETDVWELKYNYSPFLGGVQYAANLWYRIIGTDDYAEYTIETWTYSNESACKIRGTSKFGCTAEGTKLLFKNHGPG